MFKEILKSIAIGCIGLFVFNFIGQYFDLNIPINILTVAIVGFLRIPGLIILLIILLL